MEPTILERTNSSIVKFLESPLPRKLFSKGERIPADDLVGEINPLPIPIKAKPSPPFQILAALVDEDELRPALTGIYHCVDKQCMVVTNGHYMFVHPAVVEKAALIRPGNGAVIDEEFPDYLSVIPFYERCAHLTDLSGLASRLNGLVRANKFLTGIIPARISYQARSVFLDPSMFLKLITSFIQLGATKLRIDLPTGSDTVRAIVFRDARNLHSMALLMPIMQPGTQAMATVLELVPESLPRTEILSFLKQRYKKVLNEIPWGVKYHHNKLKEAYAENSEWSIQYEKTKLNQECAKWQNEIDELRSRFQYWSTLDNSNGAG